MSQPTYASGEALARALESAYNTRDFSVISTLPTPGAKHTFFPESLGHGTIEFATLPKLLEGLVSRVPDWKVWYDSF
jgi:hypothetical protein